VVTTMTNKVNVQAKMMIIMEKKGKNHLTTTTSNVNGRIIVMEKEKIKKRTNRPMSKKRLQLLTMLRKQ